MAETAHEASSTPDLHDLKSSHEGDSENCVDSKPNDFYPDGGVRAWAVAIGTAGVMFCTFGLANAFGVLQEYYASHQLSSASQSAISWIGSLQICALFSGALVGGPLFDRYGAKVIWPSAVLYVLSIMMTSIAKEYYQLMLAQGVLGGISMGMTMSPSMAATPQYFNKNRGAAMGIAVAGSSVGGVVLPIVLGKLLNSTTIGFGWSIRILGFLILAILAPSCAAIRARLPPRKGNFFLLSAFKKPLYVTIITFACLMILSIFTPIFYLPVYAVQHGMDETLASYLIAILNAASFLGRVVPGVLADKLGSLNAVIASGVSSGILILCWPKITSNAGIIVFAGLFGFCSGAIISGVVVCLSTSTDDPKTIGTYMGMGMGISSIAGLIGPPITGALVNRYHGFVEVSIFSGVMVLIGSAVAVFAKTLTDKGIFGKA
ncbi:monocarboxylate permease-like protein [Histoplasma capsulatum G186AR]|uniref:Monocarboxylate permease-like protein n=2 Tax=Ajellomyces capsulatus TaxID=5037 RepID=C0NDE7_AJECG|nr:monocarboxylate permease-like protein [Histoplasma capsulatum G186AR]EEH11688.1 monocarboxylate permease-like protein [Histoplasma capsulatum G186AR]KAG5302457.1 monocarboxylate permease-like protein [Histoplasma capsulatum]QSS72144.1 monocarboxylate permease-like protein [Histoplasma capsulatum G186AR]